MCDTICVCPSFSKTGAMLLAKNSDRDPNEPHVVRYIPAQEYSARESLRCTYITIPQARRTNAVLLFKPDWIWGAEMGVNEHGVAIGNEAVFTKIKQGNDALTGMDLLRLALERADSAEAALDIIVTLLGDHGQGGNCGYNKDFRYDNSFLIADPQNAYVLETAGKNYAAFEVKDKAAISNRLSIGTEHTLRHGIAQGEDFAKKFSEPLFSHFAQGRARRGQSLCTVKQSAVDAAQLMRGLRTHAPGLEGHEFARGSVGSVCMHAGGLIGDHTTGSFVAVLRKDMPMTIWTTGASTPCISAFKPVFFGISESAPIFLGEADGHAYWLRREQLHRAVLAGLVDAAALRARRDALEAAWLDEEARLFEAVMPDNAALAEFAARAASQEQEMVDAFYTDAWRDMAGRGRFARYWKKKNAELK